MTFSGHDDSTINIGLVLLLLLLLSTSVILEKPPFSGPILTGKYSTENHFTMAVLPCKLPLIGVLAP